MLSYHRPLLALVAGLLPSCAAAEAAALEPAASVQGCYHTTNHLVDCEKDGATEATCPAGDMWLAESTSCGHVENTDDSNPLMPPPGFESTLGCEDKCEGVEGGGIPGTSCDSGTFKGCECVFADKLCFSECEDSGTWLTTCAMPSPNDEEVPDAEESDPAETTEESDAAETAEESNAAETTEGSDAAETTVESDADLEVEKELDPELAASGGHMFALTRSSCYAGMMLAFALGFVR